MKNYKYILFDLDGTLTDSKVGIVKATQYALEYFNIKVDDLNELCKFIGPPIKEAFMEFYNFNEKDTKIAVERFREYYRETGIWENEPYKHVEKVLKELKDNGKILMVATSKSTDSAIQILKHFELLTYFDFIGGSDISKERNTKGKVIKHVLDENNISDLSKVLMIGDRKYDCVGAKENNIDSMGVLYGYGSFKELENAEANIIVKDIEDISKILI
ncbi:MAG: HAD-IA family hydrolase [Clostridium perfringens]|nr:HAD-IA family hydrolase [Clostridium perfringens]